MTDQWKGSWGYRGPSRATRAANEERASAVRLRFDRTVREYIVLRHDGSEFARTGCFIEAGDLLDPKTLGNGACVVDDEGTILRFVCDALKVDRGLAVARQAARVWASKRDTLPAPPMPEGEAVAS